MNTELLASQSENTGSEASAATVDRRDFMTWAVATPAAVAVGAKLMSDSSEAVAADAAPVKVSNYLSIDTVNKKIVLTVPRVESGQGILTSLSILVAAELGLQPSDIAPRSMTTAQATEFTTTLVGASGSTRLLTDPVRAAAADLKARAVQNGGATLANIVAKAAEIAATTPSSKPYASAFKYGGLLGKGMTITGNTATFNPGTGIARLDSDEIYSGKRKYTVDTNQDALNCLVMHSLQTRGTPKFVAPLTEIQKVAPQVKAVIPFNSGKNGFTLYTGVGIICDTMGQALDARDAIIKNNLITWNPGTAARFSTPMLNQKLKDAVGPDPQGGKLLAAKQIKGGLLVNFHHHGTLGTQAGVCEVFGDAGGAATGAEAWWASQVPKYNRQQLAQQLGLDASPTKVLLNITQGYGHFGRNALVESSAESARVADAVRKMGGIVNKNGVKTNKVKVMWSRNDYIRLCPYRPPTYSRYIVNIGSDGKTILSMNHKFVSILCELPSGVDNTQTEDLLSATNQTGFDYFPLSAPSPYTFTTNEAFREVVAPFPTGAMRAVYSVGGQGGKEVFMDEVARQTGQERFALRLKYMKSERIKGCMEALKSVWDAQLAAVNTNNANPNRTVTMGLGFGIHEEWNSAACQIVLSELPIGADIAVTAPSVKKAWSAMDVGKVTNPSGLASMGEGAISDAVALV